MKKKIVVVSIIIFVLGILFYLFINEDDKNKNVVKSSNIDKHEVKKETVKNLKTFNKNILGYHIDIEIENKSESDGNYFSISPNSKLKFDLIFDNPHEANKNKQALILNFEYNITKNKEYLQKASAIDELGFTYDYFMPQIYGNMNLLGLDKQHPLNILSILLTNISFSLNPNKIKLNSSIGEIHYEYTKKENKLIREILEYKKAGIVKNNIIGNSQITFDEDWEAILYSDQLLSSVNSKVKTKMTLPFSYKKQGKNAASGDFKIVQNLNIKVTRFEPKNIVFSPELFVADINKKHRVDTLTFNNDKLKNDKEFDAMLKELSNTLNVGKAILIGDYLTNNKTVEEISEMLSGDTLTPEEKQAILMALQEVNTSESEHYLSDLITDNNIPDRYRAAGMLNLSYMKNTSQLAIDSLKNVFKEQESAMLVETALFNIGNISRRNKLLAYEGVSFIENTLKNTTPGSKSRVVALQSAVNSRDESFLDIYIESMRSSDPRERYVASIGAIKSSTTRDKALRYLVKNEEVSGVIIPVAKQLKKTPLSYEQENLIYEKIKSEEDPKLQAAWTHLLVSNKDRFKEYEERLNNIASEPNKKGIADYLNKYPGKKK